MTAKTRCDCCEREKPDVEAKEWGRRLMLCATCRKLGRARALARIAAREAAPAGAAASGERPKRRRKPAEPEARRPTISGAVKEMCEAGRTNEEIWAVVQPRFGMPDEHRWFVAWYRRHHARRAERARAGKE